MRRDFLQFSKTKLAGTFHVAATTFVARFDLDSRRGRDWHSHRDSAHAQKIAAWSSAWHRQHHADDSQSGSVWFSYSAALYWRHRRAHRDRGAGCLCAAANNSQYGDGIVSSIPTYESRSRDGHDHRQILWQVELPLAMPVIITGVRVAMELHWRGDHCRGIGAGGWCLHFSWAATVRQYLLLAGALPAALMALIADLAWTARTLLLSGPQTESGTTSSRKSLWLQLRLRSLRL